jgi:hypothetical protein
MIIDKAQKNIQISIESVSATLLLIVLVTLTVFLISSTSNVYNRISDTGNTMQEIRTSLCFIATKVRQNDNSGSIAVVNSSYGNELVLTVGSGTDIYEDLIFFYKGTLREILIQKGDKLVPDSATVISNINAFSISSAGKSIHVIVTKNGASGVPQKDSITLALRS